ncbi:MAG: hypothetical protein OYH76_12870 [Defluviicoccus sp.]|nr:hypothetical protein [Defluviicoccus sp.]MDE0276782.1 hypothetical protein [Defluviicoccus sp.]
MDNQLVVALEVAEGSEVAGARRPQAAHRRGRHPRGDPGGRVTQAIVSRETRAGIADLSRVRRKRAKSLTGDFHALGPAERDRVRVPRGRAGYRRGRIVLSRHTPCGYDERVSAVGIGRVSSLFIDMKRKE